MTEREQIRVDVKKRLNSYTAVRAEYKQIQDELAWLEATMDAPPGSNWDGLPRGSGVSNPVERLAVKHLTLVERYQAQLVKLAEAQEYVENMIDGLDTVERLLARYRYIDGLRWEDVCEEMAYSWRQTHRIHGRLIDRLVDAEMAKQEK